MIEDTSTGTALAQELRSLDKLYPVKAVPVETDKITRLFIQQQKFEFGQVLFRRGASFLAELESELLTFPHGRTDDIVDSISQALAHKLSNYSLDGFGGPSGGGGWPDPFRGMRFIDWG